MKKQAFPDGSVTIVTKRYPSRKARRDPWPSHGNSFTQLVSVPCSSGTTFCGLVTILSDGVQWFYPFKGFSTYDESQQFIDDVYTLPWDGLGVPAVGEHFNYDDRPVVFDKVDGRYLDQWARGH